MALTSGQQRCVDTLSGPVAVSAGAGSGKTFTLTRRIVHALEAGYVDGIDEVLAITFTSKAAGEIKSRVKAALRESGRSDQALLVDAAWISTIHGACARILRAHALELGIDPHFKVADEACAKSLLDEATDDVLGRESDLSSPGGFDALFEEYPGRSFSQQGSSVEDMVRALVEAMTANPQGAASIVCPPHTASPVQLLARLAGLASDMLALAETQKASASRDKFIDATRTAIEGCEAVCAGTDDAARGESARRRLLELVAAFPVPAKSFGSADYKARAVEATQEYYAIAYEARLSFAEECFGELMELATQVAQRFAALKRDRGLLDNNDLLTFAARAMGEHPSIAAAYENRFKLIMVDEFQDTDQLQVDMIKRMAGEGFSRLCTVGDAQQSIYRFRGADVSVYDRHLQAVREQGEDGLIELADNFRSHADVLAFVDRVFSQPSVFGDSFMSLAASRDASRVRVPFKAQGPRIEVQLTCRPYKGVSADDARRSSAARLAARFAELHEAGHSAGDMVLLLGGMGAANVYAEEFRAAGLACVIAGGSIFGRAPEVLLMVRLAEVIANPKDSRALFELLSSEVFALSADDFIALSTGVDEADGILKRQSLSRGLVALQRRRAEGEAPSPQLASALDVLDRLSAGLRFEPMSRLMADAVASSGWLSRLEGQGPEGLARAANVYKAIRIVEGIEREGRRGPASVARELRLRVEVSREAPGALSSASGDFVRIMTVHASKGLEFPIVAVAELRNDGARGGKLARSCIAGTSYVSLDAGAVVSDVAEASSSLLRKCTDYAPFAQAGPEEIDAALAAGRLESAADFRAAVLAREKLGETAEMRRLLYVALTRAKEAVVCVASGRSSKVDPTGLASGVWGAVESALCGEGGHFDSGVSMLDYGGSSPARVERIDLASAEDEAEGEGGDEGEGCDPLLGGRPAFPASAGPDGALATMSLPAVEPYREKQTATAPSLREGVFSYSSIAAAQHEDAVEGDGAAWEGACAVEPSSAALDDDDAWDSIAAKLSGDADKATDLGTAFHRLAQLAVIARSPGAALERPSGDRVSALSRACNLSSRQQVRLDEALTRWFSSDAARKACRFERLRAEVPFFVQLGCGDDAPFMEGEIDLLAQDEQSRRAFVIDYKTGGSSAESAEQLHEKHLLQATCYAYAVLSQGYEQVEFSFVRVEREDAARPGQPQEVHYAFKAAELADIEAEILRRYRAAQ